MTKTAGVIKRLEAALEHTKPRDVAYTAGYLESIIVREIAVIGTIKEKA
jgi:hypothetical protein